MLFFENEEIIGEEKVFYINMLMMMANLSHWCVFYMIFSTRSSKNVLIVVNVLLYEYRKPNSKIISEANQNKGKKTEEVNENRHEHIFWRAGKCNSPFSGWF